MPLKYLFIAEFADGSRIAQESDDRSVIDPEKRSRFYDVMQEIEKGNRLLRLSLAGEGRGYTVDLRDGHFEINGVPFLMHDNPDMIDFRVIFYRQHTHNIEVSKDADKELSHTIVYCLGWQTTVDGKNYQRVMQID